MLRQRALNKASYAIADKAAILLIAVLLQPALGKYVVTTSGKVSNSVEQSAVKVENCKFFTHL